MSTPAKSILDPTFRYTSAANTDLRKTFARLRRDHRKLRAAETAKQPIPINSAKAKSWLLVGSGKRAR